MCSSLVALRHQPSSLHLRAPPSEERNGSITAIPITPMINVILLYSCYIDQHIQEGMQQPLMLRLQVADWHGAFELPTTC